MQSNCSAANEKSPNFIYKNKTKYKYKYKSAISKNGFNENVDGKNPFFNIHNFLLPNALPCLRVCVGLQIVTLYSQTHFSSLLQIDGYDIKTVFGIIFMFLVILLLKPWVFLSDVIAVC